MKRKVALKPPDRISFREHGFPTFGIIKPDLFCNICYWF